MKKVEASNASIVTILNSMTAEKKEEFLANMYYIDESSPVPLARQNVMYPQIKQALSTVGSDLKNGAVFIAENGEVTHEFKDNQVIGIVCNSHKERAVVVGDSKVPECSSFNTVEGTRYGMCRDCKKGQWSGSKEPGKGIPPECSMYMFYYVISTLDGVTPVLFRIKAKNASYQHMTKTVWPSIISKIKGKFTEKLIAFSSKEDSNKKKQKYHIWTAEPASEQDAAMSEESRAFVMDIKAKIDAYNTERFNTLKRMKDDAAALTQEVQTNDSQDVSITPTGEVVYDTPASAGKDDIVI